MEKILEKREIGGLLEYKVKCRGWDAEEDPTWEPAGNLGGSKDLIREFEDSQVKVKRLKQREISYSYIQPEVTYKMSMERKKIREMDLDGAMDNPGYKESLRSILQGSGISVRHQLFQEKKERSSHPISQLWKMAGTEFLDGGSAADLLVQTKLRKFFVDEFEEADDIIKNMVPKMTMEEISMEYTSLVLQPEFIILILKDLGLTLDEA